MTDETGRLAFEDDKGASRATWIAGALVVMIIGWMGSGYVLPSNDGDVPRETETRLAPVAVSVEQSSVEPVTLYFQAEGQAQPDRDTSIRAEASGDVAEVLVAKGEDVAERSVIARLSTTRAEADLARAREELARAQREFDNATALLERGIATADRLSQARADLASAEAALAAAGRAIHKINR